MAPSEERDSGREADFPESRRSTPRVPDVPFRPHAALFVGRQGRLGTRQIQALFRRYATLANLPPAQCHVDLMRHPIATHLLDAGELDCVQDHLGHRWIQSTLVYARISDRQRSRAIRRLERSLEIRPYARHPP
jgi:site-specific recombinase XerD